MLDTLTDERKDLRSRKQQLVSGAILDAALDLFQHKGFDETAVDDIAQAAGVSRRSFFRYFAAKDDLLANSVIEYGDALADATQSAPKAASDLEVIGLTLLAGVRHNERPEPLAILTSIQLACFIPFARLAWGLGARRARRERCRQSKRSKVR